MPIDMKAAICRSASELLTKKRTKKLTVKDIVEECGITRQTFYYHFQDVYDLLEWMLEQHRTNLEPQVSDRNAWRTAVANLLDFCLENRAMIQNLFRSISRDSLDRYTYSILLKSLTDYTRNQATQYSLSEKQCKALLQFTAHGLQGLLLTWIDGGMRVPRDELIETVDTIFSLRS